MQGKFSGESIFLKKTNGEGMIGYSCAKNELWFISHTIKSV